ncbi:MULTISPECIES: metallophosphoesterase [Thermodesulfovibrio]|uniref:metallophosphoesterase n=1 Tax=Thermodesulfovibrio TaxID=28261 RepID=UPI002638150F|nr:metallophosphoesterase [Thermodesulfovibrio sp.]
MRTFFILFFTIYGLINFYFFIKLKAALNLKGYLQLIVGFLMVVMVFSPAMIRNLEKHGYEAFAITLSWVGYIWMAFVVLFLFFGIMTDIVRLSVLIISKIFNQNFYSRIPVFFNFLFPLFLSISFLIYGYFEALKIKTERVFISSDKVSRDIKILQISDVHIGLIVRDNRIKKIAEIIKQAKPDMVISTGDLVDAQTDSINHLADIFAEIAPPYGKFAITGNHEFYAGIDKSIYFTERAGFKLLRDSLFVIEDLNINLIGLDDTEALRYGQSLNVDRKSLIDSFKNNGYTILLNHRPSIEKELFQSMDLQLSGHTHKGQFFPFSLLTKLYYKKDAGLIDFGRNKYLYISRGTGTWGPPVRIFAPPEITIIEVKKK